MKFQINLNNLQYNKDTWDAAMKVPTSLLVAVLLPTSPYLTLTMSSCTTTLFSIKKLVKNYDVLHLTQGCVDWQWLKEAGVHQQGYVRKILKTLKKGNNSILFSFKKDANCA